MNRSLKPRRRTSGPVWRFLYRAAEELAAAGDPLAVCEAAVRIAVPRLATACTLHRPAGAASDTCQAGAIPPGSGDSAKTVPLIADGKTIGVLTFHRPDGRPHNRATRAYARLVARALARATEARNERAEFAAALAHELRNAVAPVRLGIGLLQETAPDSPSGPTVDRLARLAGRLSDVVDGMVDLFRAEHGKLALRLMPVNLEDLATRAADAASLVRERGHHLSVRVTPAARTVWADPVRLEQVLTNLLLNAAWYTERGGAIDLLADRDGDAVVVRVRDTGVGLPAELLTRVFDPFFQAGPKVRGLGLGLALVRRLVGLHGGSVRAESDGPGKGSTFVVRLPATSASD